MRPGDSARCSTTWNTLEKLSKWSATGSWWPGSVLDKGSRERIPPQHGMRSRDPLSRTDPGHQLPVALHFESFSRVFHVVEHLAESPGRIRGGDDLLHRLSIDQIIRAGLLDCSRPLPCLLRRRCRAPSREGRRCSGDQRCVPLVAYYLR